MYIQGLQADQLIGEDENLISAFQSALGVSLSDISVSYVDGSITWTSSNSGIQTVESENLVQELAIIPSLGSLLGYSVSYALTIPDVDVSTYETELINAFIAALGTTPSDLYVTFSDGLITWTSTDIPIGEIIATDAFAARLSSELAAVNGLSDLLGLTSNDSIFSCDYFSNQIRDGSGESYFYSTSTCLSSSFVKT